MVNVNLVKIIGSFAIAGIWKKPNCADLIGNEQRVVSYKENLANLIPLIVVLMNVNRLLAELQTVS